LSKGFAKLDKNYKLKEEFKNWVDLENKILDKKLGMWKYDDKIEDEY